MSGDEDEASRGDCDGCGNCEGVDGEREGGGGCEGSSRRRRRGAAAQRPIYGSEEAIYAIYAAKRCEKERTWDDLPDSDDENAEEITKRRDWAENHYYDKLTALKVAFFPRDEQACCVYFEIGGCTHGKPCPCGKLRPPWPWIVHDPRGPFCACWKAAERLAWESTHGVFVRKHHGLAPLASALNFPALSRPLLGSTLIFFNDFWCDLKLKTSSSELYKELIYT